MIKDHAVVVANWPESEAEHDEDCVAGDTFPQSA
jgi:hypothetical protein